jgi:SagB-type dehydrogenase family enzyme
MAADGASLAWWFHAGTSYVASSPPSPSTAASAERPDEPLLALPPPTGLRTSLDAAIAGRASCRRFSGTPLTLEEVSTLLHVAYGATGHTAVAGFEFELRPVPSAGARYPLEIHLVVWSVAGVRPGTYRYRPFGHGLEHTGGHVSPEAGCDLFLGQRYLATAGALTVVTATVQTCLARYGDRGYRYLLLEAGHVAQNLNLATSALGLGSLNLGGFLDRSLGETLHLTVQVPLYGVAVGRRSTDDPHELRQPRPG